MTTERPDDQHRLAAWQAGEEQAGAELLAKHVGAVYRFFRRRDEETADDLTQRTMLTVVESRERLKPRGSVRAYLLGVARHIWMAELGRRRRPAPRSHAPDRDGISTAAARRELRGRLIRAMQSLTLEHQLPLELHYWEDLTTREIAEVLDIPVGTVKWRLAEARRALRGALGRLPAVVDHAVTSETEAWRAAMRAHTGAAS